MEHMNQTYAEIKEIIKLPRLPLEGSIDITYRCNNNCRHCWICVPDNQVNELSELSLEEIRHVVDEAFAMGCCKWTVSGGEPMIRPDFYEIFDYIFRKSTRCYLYTNGTLITNKIAKFLKNKGMITISLYGADSKTHDHITRRPGSFDQALRGIFFLKAVKTDFTVQIVPMRDNYYQLNDMEHLAKSLSRYYRVQAAWMPLFYSAYKDIERNREISRQRISPEMALELDKPDLFHKSTFDKHYEKFIGTNYKDNRPLASCIELRNNFHINPYGQMSFCSFIVDPKLRCDIRKNSFKKCWEDILPSFADQVTGGEEYKIGCASCKIKDLCRWCPAAAYLENGNYSSKVKYLCDIAEEKQKYKGNYICTHRRCYRIADITIQVDSELPIENDTFHPKFKLFEVEGPGEDNIFIKHFFSFPHLNKKELGNLLYKKTPWAIYRKNYSWIYLSRSSIAGFKRANFAAVFNNNLTIAKIYHAQNKPFLKGNLHSLTMFPTDQILLARILADRKGCYLHSCGVNFNGKGLLFAGHSEAGKSTMANILKGHAEILCDDRIIVREQNNEFRIHGTWSHGDVADISAGSAPLHAILFLEKAGHNRLELISDKKENINLVTNCLIKPLVSADWWGKSLELIGEIIDKIPCYIFKFNKDSIPLDLLNSL
jgi:radical SAM protein with 4Fe4S-binding SPASM domain